MLIEFSNGSNIIHKRRSGIEVGVNGPEILRCISEDGFTCGLEDVGAKSISLKFFADFGYNGRNDKIEDEVSKRVSWSGSKFCLRDLC